MGSRFDWACLEKKIPAALPFSKDPATPAGLLDAWTERRHALVHRGRALLITSPRARALVKFVESVAAEVDSIALDAINATSR